MRKLLIFASLMLFVLLPPTFIEAAVKVKVKSSMLIKKKKPSVEEARLIAQAGKLQAIKKYAAGVDNQKLKLINDLLPLIEADLDSYVLDVGYLNEGEYVNGYWEQLMEVIINDAQLELLINQQVKTQMEASEPVYISFIYVAREVSSVEVHDATRQQTSSSTAQLSDNMQTNQKISTTTKLQGKTDTVVDKTGTATVTKNSSLDANVSTSATASSESVNISSKGSTTLDNTQVKAQYNAKASESNTNTDLSARSTEKNVTTGNSTLLTQTNTKGTTTTTTTLDGKSVVNRDSSTYRTSFSSGSVTNLSEGVCYRAYNPGEIDAKVTEIFNKANFEVVPAYDVGINYEKFAYDFAAYSEISSSTQKEATDTARDAELDFLAVATLDVGREGIDPVTGSSKVYVKVTGFIMDLRKKFAVKICSVGPVQFSGLGEDPTVAKTNALIEAASHASRDLVDQLRIKIGN